MTAMNPVRLRFTAPDDAQVQRGNQYIFDIENTPETRGVILAKPGITRWRYETQPKRSVYSPLNLLRKPDFVLSDPQGKEILRVVRETRFPPRFKIVERGQTVGNVALRSILRNKYSIQFDGGPRWLFRMTLFTVYFPGVSSAGTRVWVRVGPSKRQWNLLVEPEADSVYLLAGLAFIHREWWCYS
jgi:hypothetical protein